MLWVLCEIAIAACDLAEVIGSAIALNLLFGIPLIWGVCLTALDVLLILLLQNKGFRYLEAFVIALVATIGVCFAVELFMAQPAIGEVLGGLDPAHRDRHQPGDALHRDRHPRRHGDAAQPVSALAPSCRRGRCCPTPSRKREAIRFATFDSTLALLFAFFINAAILILAAATFHQTGHQEVADIGDAYRLLTPLLGTTLASTLFAVALLASGQNSTHHRHAGRPDRDGRVPQHPAAGRGSAGSSPGSSRSFRRSSSPRMYGEQGAGSAAHPEPGDPEPAALVRRGPAGLLHQPAAEDGRVRERAGCWPAPRGSWPS